MSAEAFLYNVKKRVRGLGGLSDLGDSERIRAPCTNNAQVKFTTKKNILRLRKNNLRGSLRRQTGDNPVIVLILEYLILDRNRLFLCLHLKIQGRKKSQGSQIKRFHLLVFSQLWGILGFSLKHDLKREKRKHETHAHL